MAARLERAVHRRAARPIAGFGQRTHFRVRLTRAFVVSLPDDHTVVVNLTGYSDTTVTIATEFGGGGHRFAAGFTSARPLHETLEAIRERIPLSS